MSVESGIIALATIVVGLPVTLCMIGEIVKRHIAFKERKLELLAGQSAGNSAQYASHIERLEQRMRVLERIATDKGVDLAAQIESLRDEPASALAGPNEEFN